MGEHRPQPEEPIQGGWYHGWSGWRSSARECGGDLAPTRRTRSATAPFTGYTMAVSEPIVVEAISSFVVQMVATAKQPTGGEKVITANSNQKDTLQHEQVASFIENKANAILFFLITAAGWDADAKSATSKGIAAFNHSASAVGGMTQNCGLDQYGAGYSALRSGRCGLDAQEPGWDGRMGSSCDHERPPASPPRKGAAAAMAKFAPNAKLVSTPIRAA